MAAKVLQLCGGCTESARSTVSLPQGPPTLRFLTVDISLPIPDGMDPDEIATLAKIYCSQCKQSRETPPPSSTFPDLFSSYRPLAEAEEKVLRPRRKADQQELSIIEAVISATESHLEQLRQHREALTSSITQYNDLLSAVRRLPKEILLEIANFTIPEDKERDSLDVRGGIWAMSQVCSSWRTVIIGMPMIWSNIAIKSCESRYAMSIFLEYIRRSRNAPLDIMFTSEETERSKILFELLCSQSQRWRSLELCLHRSHWPYLSQVRNTLTQLNFLSIDDADPNHRVDPMENNDTFAFAPNLQTVRLGMRFDALSYAAPAIAFQFPPESVSSFRLWFTDDQFYPNLSHIVPRSANDVYVGTDGQYSSDKPLIPSVYPSVTCLQIGLDACLFDVFTCPGLDLLIVNRIVLNEDSMNHIGFFLDRSTQNGRLPSLDLFRNSIGVDAPVTRLFQSVHFISSLQASIHVDGGLPADQQDEDGSEQMIRLLEPLQLTVDRSNDLLPDLSNLALDCTHFNPTAALYRLIHDVVDSRVNPPADYGGKKLSEFGFTDSSCNVTLETYNDLLEQAQMNSDE